MISSWVLVILDYTDSATDMLGDTFKLFPSSASENRIIPDGWTACGTHGEPAGEHDNPPQSCGTSSEQS